MKDEVTGLKVDYKSGTTTIELRDKRGNKITNVEDTASPATGWTAKRFTKTADESRGVIITSRGGATEKTNTYSYTNFFFSTYTDETKTAKGADDITKLLTSGITVSAETATLGQVTFATTADLKDSYFGDTRPRALTAGEKQEVTFLGVEGEISCAANCSIEAVPGKDDEFQFSSAAIFTPDVPRGDDLEDVIVTLTEAGDNNKYLSFGYWLVTTDDPKHTIHTFAQGHGYSADNNGLDATPHQLKGKATYSGGAAGVYVLKTGNLADNPDLHDGEFVADVELTAQFGNGNGTIAPADQWKIEGNIDRFRSSNTAHDLSGWDLELSADLGTRNPATGTDPNQVPSNSTAIPSNYFTSIKETTNGVTNALRPGTLAVAFYGNAGAGTAANAADDHPEAVVGEFDGHFINGHVVGAFGAVKDD